jgi:hypothetical protein
VASPRRAPAASPRRLTRPRHDGSGAVTTTRRVQPTARTPATSLETPAAELAESPDVTQPAGGPAQAGEAASGLLPQQLARFLGAIVAPTTLFTALLYYFGWSHAYWFCNYFGVNSTVLGFTTTDYLMRSVDALFVPMTVAASAGLVAVWAHYFLRARLSAGSHPRAFRFILPIMAIVGGVLVLGGFASVFTQTVLSEHLVAAPLSLGVGVLVLVYAVHLRRFVAEKVESTSDSRGWGAVVEWTVVFVLVGLSLFWAATDYSAAVGRARAIDFVAGLRTYPNVVIFSERSLSLQAPGVREVRCKDAGAAYRFRYDGLKLVLESGHQYLFLPADWTPADGVAILIPQANSLRLEFYPARPQPPSGTASC